ncbi:MAG: capsular biosynthesis protein [Prevotella sp.]|nr:capsular biosynthesis protein [Candidatus Prevotella equi]
MFNGFTDYHSHILPGVDDGIRHMDDALEVLKHYESLGVKKVWLTPHIMEDIPNTTSELRERFEELKSAYKGGIELKLAAENMIDNLFVKRLEQGDVLPHGDRGKELLLETSYVQAPYGFYKILQDVKKAGYTPILAHPERYRYMELENYDKLRAQGVLFQMNIMSLSNAYGPEARKRAEYLLENDMYSYYGSDLHNLGHFKEMTEEKCIKKKIADILSRK